MLKIAFSPIYKYQLPEGHRFPMEKYELIPEQLLYEGTITAENLFSPTPLTKASVLRAHTLSYWEKLMTQTLSAKEIRKIGFPMRPELIQRGLHIAGGTLECAKHAIEHGVSLNVAGGTHHSFAGHGEGFCIFNDFAIASMHLIEEMNFKSILIVDLDVHQGNGTAKIFEHEPRVFTFSIHGEKNYPGRKENSDLDIGLRDGTADEEYLEVLGRALPKLIAEQKPELIFYLSGVDILATDKLGRLGLSIEGCKKRDQYVFSLAHQHSIPIAVSMGGGYSERISTIVEAHANTFRVAKDIFF